jgi:hypothetical protein
MAGKDLRAVLQVVHGVAAEDRRPEQHAHLAPELRIVHRVAVFDLRLQLFFRRREVEAQDDERHCHQGRHDDDGPHALPAPDHAPSGATGRRRYG